MADPILERIHELPVAASWNGFFPQDKPEGPTECVSVATVEAKLVEDGFVKTGVLVAGYQPLENQRLRTTDSPTFAAATIAGWKLRNDPAVPTAYANIYGDGIITPSDSNWSLSIARNGGAAFLNGSSNVGLNVANAPILTAYSNRVDIATKLQIAGVDRITNAGGFVGTSLQISGATANKLARFDASKNLVSYDLVAGDIPILNQSTTGNAATATKWATARTLTIGATGKTIDGTGNQSWSLAEIGAQAAGSCLPVNNPAFTGVLTGLTSNVGGMVSKTYSADADYFTILGDGAAVANYTLTSSRNGAVTYVGASTHVGLALSGTEKLYITSAGVTIPTLTGATTRIATINAAGQIGATDSPNVTKLQIAGVDRITAAGGFVGTSLQISGATANKLARFDASKNLVSYDLVAGDIPALSYLSKTTPVYDQHIWPVNSSSTLVDYDCRNHIVSGTSPFLYPNHMVAGSEYVFLLRPGTQFSFTHSTGTPIIVWNGALVTQVLSITKTIVRAYCDGVYWYLE